MRRSLTVVTTIAALLLARPPASGQELILERFGETLDALRVQAHIPGLSATVVGLNGIVWEAAFGKQEIEHALPTRSDTPFQIDGVTQTITAMLVLGCTEVGRLPLDFRIGQLFPNAPEPNATVYQLLSHTSADGTFRYRLDRLNILASVVGACQEPFALAMAKLFDQQAMFDSVPGQDIVHQTPSDFFTAAVMDRYSRALARLATPYSVDSKGQPSQTRYTTTTLLASGGVISTTRDLAKFLVGLMRGIGVAKDITALMWKAAVGPNGQPNPHGLGWFVQSYNGETVVWQFGLSENASSSLMVTVPGRGISLVLLANSDGLSRPFPLAAGDLTVSPFGRLILGSFVR